MKLRMGMWAVIGVVPFVAYASETPPADAAKKDAKEILVKVDEATKKVQAVRYKSTKKGTGAVAAREPAVQGTVILVGKQSEGSGKFRVEAKVTPPGSSEAREVVAGSDGETYFVIDHKTKTVHEDIDPSVMGSAGRTAQGIFVQEFSHPTPFSDEIKADKLEMKEDKKIGSEDCYQIHVFYAGGQGESIWCFSKKDFLPRAREQLFKTREGEPAGRAYELTELEVDPKISEDTFKVVVPEGYKKTDDFAP